MKYTTILAIFLVLSCAYPASSMSRWFTSSFNDLKFTLHRYGHCYTGLSPVSSSSLNETEFLIHEIRNFLDQGNYDNEQLANVSSLMDNICRPNIDTSYPISLHIDVGLYGNNYTKGKENRCRAIDEAMDSMYYVFKRAALNHSEPLDFSTIVYYPNATDRRASYNLTDLINTSWIKSETILEHVCGITNATKEYIVSRSSNATAQARAESLQSVGVMGSLFDYIDRMIDRLLGLQKRLYWESSTRVGVFGSRVGSGLGSIRDGIGSGLSRTRQVIFGNSRTNSTSAVATVGLVNSTLVNSTTSTPALSLQTTPSPVVRSSSTSYSISTSTSTSTSLPASVRTSGSTTTTTSPKASLSV